MNFDMQHTQVAINAEVHGTFTDAFRCVEGGGEGTWLRWVKLHISE